MLFSVLVLASSLLIVCFAVITITAGAWLGESFVCYATLCCTVNGDCVLAAAACLLACNFHKIAEEQLLFSSFVCRSAEWLLIQNNNKNNNNNKSTARNVCEFVLLRKKCLTIRLAVGTASQQKGRKWAVIEAVQLPIAISCAIFICVFLFCFFNYLLLFICIFLCHYTNGISVAVLAVSCCRLPAALATGNCRFVATTPAQWRCAAFT